ncbi:hypothetical protein HYDPIDRAFT_34685 [Hydnomerulius pinastri MD-312]|uniref:Unplaced genomic scaffold scaffold_222, whole genome shotgun sequence n=1 Tax=Hydnomerulius pinastri MD-312 TaxID=994086 RepID=A0A0C9VK86_9AGAM|nr:hypothetical protein HYDPIDRAFT_34685 [Hydnomerulius pinastri MD-312]
MVIRFDVTLPGRAYPKTTRARLSRSGIGSTSKQLLPSLPSTSHVPPPSNITSAPTNTNYHTATSGTQHQMLRPTPPSPSAPSTPNSRKTSNVSGLILGLGLRIGCEWGTLRWPAMGSKIVMEFGTTKKEGGGEFVCVMHEGTPPPRPKWTLAYAPPQPNRHRRTTPSTKRNPPSLR